MIIYNRETDPGTKLAALYIISLQGFLGSYYIASKLADDLRVLNRSVFDVFQLI